MVYIMEYYSALGDPAWEIIQLCGIQHGRLFSFSGKSMEDYEKICTSYPNSQIIEVAQSYNEKEEVWV